MLRVVTYFFMGDGKPNGIGPAGFEKVDFAVAFFRQNQCFRLSNRTISYTF